MGPIDLPPPPPAIYEQEVGTCPLEAYIALSFVWPNNQDMREGDRKPGPTAKWFSENWEWLVKNWRSPAKGARFMISGHDSKHTPFGRWVEHERGPPLAVYRCDNDQVRFYK